MTLALSTSWNAFRHDRGNDLIFEIKALGFEKVELSFNLTPDILNDIAALSARGDIAVTSVHNYCPIPPGLSRQEGLPDCFSMASRDEAERSKAVSLTKISIDTAARMKARCVVLHCGRVEMPDHTRKLIELARNGKSESAEFAHLKDEMLQSREAQSKRFFDNLLKSLDELNQYAQKKNISLGIENRFYFREIPNFDEIDRILKAFPRSSIAYWHDTGHAHIMEHLGFTQGRSYLGTYGESLLGAHLHNADNLHDHQAPSEGAINFSSLRPYIKDTFLAVIEAHHPTPAHDIIKSKLYLEKLLDDKR